MAAMAAADAVAGAAAGTPRLPPPHSSRGPQVAARVAPAPPPQLPQAPARRAWPQPLARFLALWLAARSTVPLRTASRRARARTDGRRREARSTSSEAWCVCASCLRYCSPENPNVCCARNNDDLARLDSLSIE
jgi:hypothetical protein